MKTADEIKIICPECRREYFVPAGMLTVWSSIEMKCKTCTSILRIDTLKEQMKMEIMKIVERSGYL